MSYAKLRWLVFALMLSGVLVALLRWESSDVRIGDCQLDGLRLGMTEAEILQARGLPECETVLDGQRSIKKYCRPGKHLELSQTEIAFDVPGVEQWAFSKDWVHLRNGRVADIMTCWYTVPGPSEGSLKVGNQSINSLRMAEKILGLPLQSHMSRAVFAGPFTLNFFSVPNACIVVGEYPRGRIRYSLLTQQMAQLLYSDEVLQRKVYRDELSERVSLLSL